MPNAFQQGPDGAQRAHDAGGGARSTGPSDRGHRHDATDPDHRTRPTSLCRSGFYPFGAPAGLDWQAPTDDATMGRGGIVYLGAYDTRPDDDHDAAIVSTLQPVAAHGGLTLRWTLPKSGSSDDHSAQPMPSMGPHGTALVLFLASFDTLPAAKEFRGNGFPGLAPGATDLDLQADNGADLVESTPDARAGIKVRSEQRDGFLWASRFLARPALELLSYTGGPAAEADLAQLAGGGRYVVAWLRCFWTFLDGVDPMPAADVNYKLAWSITNGRPFAPCHATAWHVAFPVDCGAGSADAFDAAYANTYGLASPFAGTWIYGATNNAATEAAIIGLELRSSMILARSSRSVTPASETSVTTVTTFHGGAARISAVNASGDPIAALVHVSVTR